jgi:ComF family protein
MLQPLINDFMSLIYPNPCPACKQLLLSHESFICGACQLSLPYFNTDTENLTKLQNKFKGRIPYQNVSSYLTFEKGGRVQSLLHSLKYKENKALGHFLGSQFAQVLKQEQFFEGKDYLLPVPLHATKLKQRGFNQSEVFANGLAEISGIPVINTVLIRHKQSTTQTKKQQFERWENVESIFSLINITELEGKHVILIDDVITTGATIEAAWLALKEVSHLKLSVLSLAFAIKG